MKTIAGLEKYGITEAGEIFNLETGRRLKTYTNAYGYETAQFTYRKKHYIRTVHRLIAQAYIPNPEQKPCINHIDGNKLNNRIENLECCTYREITEHAAKVLKVLTQYAESNRRRQRPVRGIYPDGSETEIYESIRSACNATGANAANLVAVLKGKRKTCCGAAWIYI